MYAGYHVAVIFKATRSRTITPTPVVILLLRSRLGVKLVKETVHCQM